MTRAELISLCASILMSGDSERRSTPRGWLLEATEMVDRVEKQESDRFERLDREASLTREPMNREKEAESL